MKFSLYASALAILVAGCTQITVDTPPVNITPKVKADAVGLDVYARPRSRGNPVPRFRGQETVTVRSTGRTSGGGSGEIGGVPCTLDSGVYTAAFTTPANVIVPDYGPNSPALFIRCEHPDGRKGSRTVNVFNHTSAQRGAAAYGTGILGAIVIGAVNAAQTDPETDDFKYPAVSVPLK